MAACARPLPGAQEGGGPPVGLGTDSGTRLFNPRELFKCRGESQGEEQAEGHWHSGAGDRVCRLWGV